jgi:hypothetical protein
MDFVKYTPWLAPLVLIAMLALAGMLNSAPQNTGRPASNTSSR